MHKKQVAISPDNDPLDRDGGTLNSAADDVTLGVLNGGMLALRLLDSAALADVLADVLVPVGAGGGGTSGTRHV
jgi:hypothetical protein